MLLKLLERLDSRFLPRVISLTNIGEVGQRIQALGLSVDALGMRPAMVPSPTAFFRLVRRLRQIKPDVVHTWMYHADLIGGLAARLAGVPAVAWGLRNTNLDRDKTKLSTIIVVRISAFLSRWLPDRICSCSHVARQAHADLGYAMEKMAVIPNGFDLTRFQPCDAARAQVRLELGVSKDTPLVGLIGRFDPHKNHAGFFEAARLMNKNMPNVHLLLAGNGIDEKNEELMQVVQKSGVGSVTHLLGQRSDIPRLMAALDVLASSSHGEAFPNVLGEAMACGVGVLVSNEAFSQMLPVENFGQKYCMRQRRLTVTRWRLI